jgi:phosphorylcholine metabolism protein LicD
VSNYCHYVEASTNLELFLKLHKSLFQIDGFLKQFKISDDPKPFVGKNRVFNSFDYTYSTTAYWNKLVKIYEAEDDPESFLLHHKLVFHWADWVDTSPANAFISAYDSILHEFDNDEAKLFKKINSICFGKLFDNKDSWLDEESHRQSLSVFEHVQSIGICSAIHRYYYQMLPENVVFETDFKYFKWPVKQSRLAEPLGVEGLASVYYDKPKLSSEEIANFEQNHFTAKPDLVRQLKNVSEAKNLPVKKISLKQYNNQKFEDFKQPDIDKLIKKYNSIERPTREEKKHLEFLRYSKANVGNADKFYFTFPFIQADTRAELHHYTFPWVKQIISPKERTVVVHHLVRSWFKFCEQAGVVSWFNYGNLIGWYRNSRNMPWDNDVDVQLSISDMDILGKNWNNSLIVENPEVGDRMFWFQTNPYYMQQKDNQFIDARFIDVKSGIYIDISALWHSGRDPPGEFKDIEKKESLYHCKHYNWFSHDEIFPLRRTLYEGAQAYAPNKYDAILMKFYGEKSKSATNNYDHNWQPDIGVWVPNQVCENSRIPKKRFDNSSELTLFGACNNTEVWQEWNETRKAYEIHKKEFALLQRGRNASYLSEEDLPVFRHFDYNDYR